MSKRAPSSDTVREVVIAVMAKRREEARDDGDEKRAAWHDEMLRRIANHVVPITVDVDQDHVQAAHRFCERHGIANPGTLVRELFKMIAEIEGGTE